MNALDRWARPRTLDGVVSEKSRKSRRGPPSYTSKDPSPVRVVMEQRPPRICQSQLPARTCHERRSRAPVPCAGRRESAPTSTNFKWSFRAQHPLTQLVERLLQRCHEDRHLELDRRRHHDLAVAASGGIPPQRRAFTRWLVKSQRIASDALAELALLNAKTNVRHKRRALPLEELRALLAAAKASQITDSELTGPDRAMLYAVAMTTGYRAGELASMSSRSFKLDAEVPVACVRAGYSKNREESTQPLPTDVAAALRTYVVGRPTDGPLWPGSWHENAAEMLRGDLAAAEIPYRDDSGEVARLFTPCGTPTSPCSKRAACGRSSPRNWHATLTSA